MLQVKTLQSLNRLANARTEWREDPADTALRQLAEQHGGKKALLAAAQRDPAVKEALRSHLKIEMGFLASELDGMKELLNSMAADIGDIKLILQEDAFLPQGLPPKVRWWCWEVVLQCWMERGVCMWCVENGMPLERHACPAALMWL